VTTPAFLGYESAKGCLARQEATLDNLRSRAATIFTANALVASFLGTRALGTDGALHRVDTWLGIGGFLGASVLIGIVLLPLFDWDFGMEAKEVERYVCIGADTEMTPDAYQRLATENEAYIARNEPKLNNLMWALIVAGVLILMSSVSWLIEVAAHSAGS
jgi:hypothetical protein